MAADDDLTDGDDLTEPLGLEPGRPRLRPAAVAWLAGGAAAVAAAAGLYVWYDGRPDTVDPVGFTGSIESAPDEDGAPALVAIEPDGALIDPAGEVVIHDPSTGGPVRLAALPDIDLVEEGPYGPLPRIAASGLRPLEAYARPTSADSRDDRVAIVIGGVGINAEGTAAAIRALPGAVTLAVAPYGEDLQDTVSRARQAGHELLLQVPMEPFNYPATDPGPHTLTLAADDDANLDNLHWLLGRITNYVGIVNYLGARFTADEEALRPVVDEVGARGLMWLDDGSSGRSFASTLAPGRAPFLRADVVLDADLTSAAIDRRLDQLRALARERGYAVATASAFPLTIERVAAFVERAEARGIAIVPVSALVRDGRG